MVNNPHTIAYIIQGNRKKTGDKIKKVKGLLKIKPEHFDMFIKCYVPKNQTEHEYIHKLYPHDAEYLLKMINLVIGSSPFIRYLYSLPIPTDCHRFTLLWLEDRLAFYLAMDNRLTEEGKWELLEFDCDSIIEIMRQGIPDKKFFYNLKIKINEVKNAG